MRGETRGEPTTAPAGRGSVADGVAPFIVRLAGLPADAVDPFAGGETTAVLDRLAELEGEIAHRRTELVDRLYAAVPGAPAEERRLFLDVKRDLYNGGALTGHRDHPLWPALEAVDAELVADLAGLEERRGAEEAAFGEAYDRQVETERLHLVHLARHRQLIRGLALGSATTARLVPRLVRRALPDWGRRERRLELTLARYATRAAVKLSPFSTLTRVGLGLADPDLPAGALRPVEGRRERSFLRLRRYLIEQRCHLLLEHPGFRRSLPVVLEPTLESLGDDRYRFVRPGRWQRSDRAGEDLRYRQPALVQVTLRGPLLACLRETLRRPLPREEAVAVVTDALAAADDFDRESVRSSLELLEEHGIVTVVPPWRETDLHLEPHLAAALPGAVGDDPHLARLGELFARLTALEETYAEADDPVAHLVEAEELVAESGRLVRGFGGDDEPVTEVDGGEPRFNEDVFLVGETGEVGEILRVGREGLEEALDDLQPLVRIANLGKPQHDLLYALGAFGARHFPTARRVPLMDFFEAVQPLFKEYLRHTVSIRHRTPLKVDAFDPLGLEPVARLERARRRVWDGLDGALEAEGDEMVFRRQVLEALLAEVPDRSAAPEPFSVHLQPLGARAGTSDFVLNALFEGAGRHSSRYTPLMPPAQQALWTGYFEERATIPWGDETAELMGLALTAGSNSNLHLPQTPRVLALRGDVARLPAERILQVRRLRVELRGDGEPPVLVDPEGRRILPVHLGGTVFRFLPNIFKFLVVFGPGELQRLMPKKGRRREADVEVDLRHRIGRVVVSRRRWLVAPTELADRLAGRDEPGTFAALHRWRSAQGIPHRVFVREPLGPGPHPQRKPQYIDFRSPLLVRIFLTILDTDVARVSIEEALPDPDSLPLGADGGRRAVELQVDHLALSRIRRAQPERQHLRRVGGGVH